MSGKCMELDPGFLFADANVSNDTLAALSAGTTDQAAGVQVNGDAGAGYSGALMLLEVGATTGTPTSFSVTFRLQDSDDNATFANVTGVDDVVISAVNTSVAVGVNTRRMRQYVRWQLVVAFVAGASPTVEVGHCVAFTRTTRSG